MTFTITTQQIESWILGYCLVTCTYLLIHHFIMKSRGCVAKKTSHLDPANPPPIIKAIITRVLGGGPPDLPIELAEIMNDPFMEQFRGDPEKREALNHKKVTDYIGEDRFEGPEIDLLAILQLVVKEGIVRGEISQNSKIVSKLNDLIEKTSG